MQRWRASEHLAKGVLALFAGVIVATAVMAWTNTGRLRGHDAAVTHSWQVLNGIERLMSTLKDVETGQRGYLLTGDPAYLAPYQQAVTQVRRRQDELLVLVAGDAQQVDRMKRMQPLVAQRLDEAALVLGLNREGTLRDVRARLLEGRGKAAMDAIRALAADMTAAEEVLLATRLQTVEAANSYAQGVTLVAAFTGLALVALAYFLYHREHAVNELALAALRTQGERFRTTLASIGDGVIVTSAAGTVEFVNPIAQQLTGWGEDAIGRNVEDVFRIVNEETRQPVQQPVREVLDRGVIVGLANHTILIAKDGSERPIEDSAAPIRHDAGGVATGVVLVFRDATGQREAQRQLLLSEAELREADERKDVFLAMLAHELRNPLAPIRVSVQLLKQIGSSDPAALERAREVIERQSGTLSRLVDDLMDAASIRSGKVRLEMTNVHLGDVVARALEQCQPIIEARRHRLHVSVPDEPVHVEGDVYRLTQVVSNLLTNSAKYTPENGDIWLSVQSSGERAEIRVRDAGLGIAPEMLPRVFDLFMQAPDAARQTGGLGIGLALVKRLVELHGGTVAAMSDGVGKGSEFVITLPCCR
jgi:PAS domain S-box-containing protein